MRKVLDTYTHLNPRMGDPSMSVDKKEQNILLGLEASASTPLLLIQSGVSAANGFIYQVAADVASIAAAMLQSMSGGPNKSSVGFPKK